MTTTDRINMREAAAFLGVSHAKMWQLVRDGTLPAQVNPLDRRQKLIRVADLERLKGDNRIRRFVSDGSDTARVDIPSDRIKDWVRATWSPLPLPTAQSYT